MIRHSASRAAFTLLGTSVLLGAAGLPGSRVPDPPHRPPPALRRVLWKPQTHVFAANIALRDAITDGKVSIPPYGEFPVAAAALRALKAAPASYRAGVLAPDLFPDMYVGGFFIHSDLEATADKWIADDWMRHVWTRARAYDDPAQKDKVMAFAYGFLTHAAGDMFAHTYVNEKADGAWNNPNISTVKKHIVLEGYVGSHTPPTDLTLDVWPRFVSNTLIKDAVARRHISAPHYRTFLKIYDWLGPPIERAKREMNNTVGEDAPYWAKCSANPIACARKEQMESWRLDIDRGFRALVDSNQTLGEKIMEGETAAGIGAITGWATEWAPKMFGAHAVGEGAVQMKELLAWIGDPLAPVTKPIKDEVDRFLKQEFREYYALYEALENPSYWMDRVGFPAGTKELVNQEMHLRPGPDSLLNWSAFEPLYNTVVLSKLALLDGDGLNALAARAGVSGQLFTPGPATNVMLDVFRSMTLSYQWVGEVVDSDTGSARTRFGVCGPEDGSILPKQAQCGIKQRNYKTQPSSAAADVRTGATRTGGFALWGHADAREKIFRVIFKGFGAGPGMPMPNDAVADIGRPGSDTRDGSRGLRVAAEQVERMRELVAGMREKVAGTVSATDAASTAAPARPANVRLPGQLPAGRAAAANPPTKVPASGGAISQSAIITNWGERCCANDVAELRAALALLGRTSGMLQPAVGARLGRPGVGQLGARIGELGAAIDTFTSTRDGQGATVALGNVAKGVEVLAKVVMGSGS